MELDNTWGVTMHRADKRKVQRCVLPHFELDISVCGLFLSFFERLLVEYLDHLIFITNKRDESATGKLLIFFRASLPFRPLALLNAEFQSSENDGLKVLQF